MNFYFSEGFDAANVDIDNNAPINAHSAVVARPDYLDMSPAQENAFVKGYMEAASILVG